MSNHPSRNYYSSSRPSSSRQPNQSQTLPPIRAVLGEELNLPVRAGTSYDMREMGRALPARSSTSASVSTHPAPTRGAPHLLADQGMYPHQGYEHRDAALPPYGGRSESAHRGGYDDQNPARGRDSQGYSGYDPATSRYSPPESSSRTGAGHGSKKYVCTWPGCNRRFERKNALDTHMNIHTDAKPFACPLEHCGKVFNVRSNMRRHLLTHKECLDHGMVDDDDDDMGSQAYRGSSGHASSRAYPGEQRPSSSAAYYSSSRRP